MKKMLEKYFEHTSQKESGDFSAKIITSVSSRERSELRHKPHCHSHLLPTSQFGK